MSKRDAQDPTPADRAMARDFVAALRRYEAGVARRYGVLDDFTLQHALHEDGRRYLSQTDLHGRPPR